MQRANLEEQRLAAVVNRDARECAQTVHADEECRRVAEAPQREDG